MTKYNAKAIHAEINNNPPIGPNEARAIHAAFVEIAREYFTNPDFRSRVEQATWDIINPKH